MHNRLRNRIAHKVEGEKMGRQVPIINLTTSKLTAEQQN
jgi:hypothetical protein